MKGVNIDDDKDVMFFRAYLTAKDMYSEKVAKDLEQRVGHGGFVNNKHQALIKRLTAASALEEEAQIVREDLDEYEYSMMHLHGRLIQGKNVPKVNKDNIHVIAERTEQHLDAWIGHLDNVTQPELEKFTHKIENEHKKMANFAEIQKVVYDDLKVLQEEGQTLMAQRAALAHMQRSFNDQF